MQDNTIHIAITRRIRKTHVDEFEHALSDFASRSLAVAGTRGVHLLYPAPGSGSTEYGIMRSFASPQDRDAFYETRLYRDWQHSIEHMIEGEPVYRDLHGLEAFFRERGVPRWKMALLTWIAVWPVSMLVRERSGWRSSATGRLIQVTHAETAAPYQISPALQSIGVGLQISEGALRHELAQTAQRCSSPRSRVSKYLSMTARRSAKMCSNAPVELGETPVEVVLVSERVVPLERDRVEPAFGIDQRARL